MLRAARAADKALIADVSVFDVFEGPRAEAQMGPGKKSLAIAVRLQPTERTLTDAEIEAVGASHRRAGDERHRRRAAELASEEFPPSDVDASTTPERHGCGDVRRVAHVDRTG